MSDYQLYFHSMPRIVLAHRYGTHRYDMQFPTNPDRVEITCGWYGYDALFLYVISQASLNFASYAASQDKAVQTRLTEIADAVANVQ